MIFDVAYKSDGAVTYGELRSMPLSEVRLVINRLGYHHRKRGA